MVSSYMVGKDRRTSNERRREGAEDTHGKQYIRSIPQQVLLAKEGSRITSHTRRTSGGAGKRQLPTTRTAVSEKPPTQALGSRTKGWVTRDHWGDSDSAVPPNLWAEVHCIWQQWWTKRVPVTHKMRRCPTATRICQWVNDQFRLGLSNVQNSRFQRLEIVSGPLKKLMKEALGDQSDPCESVLKNLDIF